MKTGFLYDEQFLNHVTGDSHPECPQRLRVIHEAIESSNLLSQLTMLAPADISTETLSSIHSLDYIDRLNQACLNHDAFIDSQDTTINHLSFQTAKLAAGSLVNAGMDVFDAIVDNAFCLMRPPGHHALKDRAMGFCLLNNIALCAQSLINDRGVSRVLILDWDVHHGNGTQEIFYERKDVLYISLHQHPFYPGTGSLEESGLNDAEGYNLNIPLKSGSGDMEYKLAFEAIVEPKIHEYKPEVILISCGFDAHSKDPLSNMNVSVDGFRWMTSRIKSLAAQYSNNRIISVLEGGYDLEILGQCAIAHIEELMA